MALMYSLYILNTTVMITRYTYIHLCMIDVLPPLHIPYCEANIFQ